MDRSAAMHIRKMEREDIPCVVQFHRRYIGHSAYSRLGPDFLALMYEGMLPSRNAVCLICAKGPEIAGYMVAAADTAALMRDVLLHGAGGFLRCMLRDFRPYRELAGQLLTTFSYFRKAGTGEPAAELLFVALEPAFRKKGIAARLLEAAVSEMKTRSIPSVKVTIAEDNEAAARHLRSCGFVLHSAFVFYGVPRRMFVKSSM